MTEWTAGTNLTIALAAFLLGWYVIGLYRDGRRAGQLVRQVRGFHTAVRGCGDDPVDRTQRLPDRGRQAAGRHDALGVSIPSRAARDLPALDHQPLVEGRREWPVLSVSLTEVMARGAFEVYHPRRRGAMDSAGKYRYQVANGAASRPIGIAVRGARRGRSGSGAGGPEHASRGGRVASVRAEQSAAVDHEPSHSDNRNPGALAGVPADFPTRRQHPRKGCL